MTKCSRTSPSVQSILECLGPLKLRILNCMSYLLQYLRLVGTNEAQEMINIVMQQYNYRQVTSYRVSDTADVSHIIKGADWDKSQ